MLEVSHVTKRYGNVLANNDISLKVEDGQTAVLLGPNGAGKSTLIKSICGLLRYQGKITINGQDVRSLEAKRNLGYVPEMPSVYELLTVAEHLEFVRRAYRVEDNGYGEELLRRFELWEKKDALGKTLSKGMQQKLSICCALSHRPNVVIFDEPMVGLDPHAVKELKTVFGELRDSGASLLISTHMIDSVEDCWDAVHILMKGSFAATKTRAEVEEGLDLEQLFFSITEGTEVKRT